MSSAKGISLDAEPQVYCEVEGLQVPVDEASVTLAGLFLNSPTPPAMDAEVELFLRHREDQAQVRGLVVKRVTCEEAARTGGRPGCGVLFTDMGAKERAFLNSVVAAISGHNDGFGEPTAKPEAKRKSPIQQTIPMQATAIRIEVRGPTANSPAPQGRQVTAPFEQSGRHTGERPALPAMRAQMRTELERQASYAPYRVLRVGAKASAAEARTAYLRLSKEFHPHRYARYDDEELNGLVTEVFIGYKRAYRAFVQQRGRS